ncbi:SDR family oxidoreductase [Lysobacter sp. MMG2]|uniref:SDR family oxidoreductase n=1 Tax=Lysobacter sp. MMG2 TaxID=2801338 RepID=UPI001C23F65D|nr:SDR family oxidoreductase [Lysobacter sp. MMG2]MBU8974636.1 SDR family oxidoreductase [Lysobacter sp. MMG2]
MICITGAGGTLGSEVLAQLQAAGAPIRAAFHSDDKADAARAQGIDVALIDFEDPDSLREAFAGCESLFLLGHNAVDQTELELAAVDAARSAGIRHIVKQSVMGAQGEDYSLAQVHRPIEMAIEASGIGWTFLRPNSFMQNVMTFMSPTIRTESAFYSASDDARISHVDVRDIAAVAVQALLHPGQHAGHAYTLTGPDAFTYDELAETLSHALGRTITHVALPPNELRYGMADWGLPDEIADRLIDLERYFRSGEAALVTGDIERITGRAPRRFADYAREVAPLLG